MSYDYPSHHRPDPEPITGRRSFLRWLINGMGVILGAILAIPVVAYLIDPRNRAAAASVFKDVVRLSQLPVGEPREFVIRETIRDAWTLRPNETVGRVFLIRRNQDVVAPDVAAFSTICPHLGCSVNFTGETAQGQTAFLCPCHGGRFSINGEKFDGNPAPRNMDDLAVHVRPIDGEDDKMVQIEFKRFYSGPNRTERVEIK